MRIVAYNILDGGENRLDLLVEVLEDQQPDVVGLVEADDERSVGDIAARLGMHHVHARGNLHASALLSRYPIVGHENHARERRELSRSLLEAAVALDDGVILVCGVLHLHPHAREVDERRREHELDVVLEVFAEHRAAARPHVLMGDFNANALHQQIDPERCKPRTLREWEENGGYIPRRVIPKLRAAGYLDAVREVLGTEADTTGTFTTEYPGQRVDYIFTYGVDRARLQSAWIHRDRPAREASDHFAVGVRLQP